MRRTGDDFVRRNFPFFQSHQQNQRLNRGAGRIVDFQCLMPKRSIWIGQKFSCLLAKGIQIILGRRNHRQNIAGCRLQHNRRGPASDDGHHFRRQVGLLKIFLNLLLQVNVQRQLNRLTILRLFAFQQMTILVVNHLSAAASEKGFAHPLNSGLADQFAFQIAQVLILAEQGLFFLLHQADPADNLAGRRPPRVKPLALRANLSIPKAAQFRLGFDQMLRCNFKNRIGLLHLCQTQADDIGRLDCFFLQTVLLQRAVRMNPSPVNITAHLPNPVVDSADGFEEFLSGIANPLRKGKNAIETVEILGIARLNLITKKPRRLPLFKPLPLHLSFPKTVIKQAGQTIVDIAVKIRHILSQHRPFSIQNIAADGRQRLGLQNLLVGNGLPIFLAMKNLEKDQPSQTNQPAGSKQDA